jgi:hypothetical protein
MTAVGAQTRPSNGIAEKLRRFRGQSIRLQLRTVFLRVWPLSLLARGYYRVRYVEPIWQNVLNRSARRALLAESTPLDVATRSTVDTLRRDGIVITDLNTFLGDPGAADRAIAAGMRLLDSEEMRLQLEGKQAALGGKSYVLRVLPPLDLSDGLTSLALNERLLTVVAHYLGMRPRLKSFELWNNQPVDPTSKETASMQWHRDYDDHKIVKVFLYLVDVDAQMGPFTYLRETQPGARFGHLFPSRPPEGSVPPKADVERLVPPAQLQQCTGKKGSFIICDTTGLHRGGRSTTKSRILFTLTYASDAAIDPDKYTLGENARDLSRLSPAARFALRRS